MTGTTVYDTILRQKRNFKHGKIMNSTVLPYFQFGMNCQCLAGARLTWPAYEDGRKLENSSV